MPQWRRIDAPQLYLRDLKAPQAIIPACGAARLR
jgi:hypothetical protein